MAQADISTAVLSYKYRLRPTRKQHEALERICEDQRLLYNAALEERIDCYRKTGKGLSYIDQCKGLAELRKELEYRSTPSNLQRWTLRRLDIAFSGFLSRAKRGDKPGFPRFKCKSRWSSFGFTEFLGIRLIKGRLHFKGLPGTLRVNIHRDLPMGKMGNVSFCI